MKKLWVMIAAVVACAMIARAQEAQQPDQAAELIKLGEDVYRLQCQTFMVIDAGQMLEEEVRLANIRSRPYQKMLNEVKNRLK